jgi:translation initiation factor 2 alpha subunit (eIF-2alpha)
MAAKSIGMQPVELYNKIADKFLKTYFYIYQGFEDVVNGNISLKDFLDEKTSTALQKTIKDKIKPKIIYVAGDITISIWEENGVDTIKSILVNAKKSDDVSINYLGGGRYRVLVKGTEYKSVEKILKDVSDNVINNIKKNRGKVEYERVKNLAVEEA